MPRIPHEMVTNTRHTSSGGFLKDCLPLIVDHDEYNSCSSVTKSKGQNYSFVKWTTPAWDAPYQPR